MSDILRRFKKLQQNVADKKAEKKVAEEKIKELEKELADKGIKPEKLGEYIKEQEEVCNNLKEKIEIKLKEAEDALTTTDTK